MPDGLKSPSTTFDRVFSQLMRGLNQVMLDAREHNNQILFS